MASLTNSQEHLTFTELNDRFLDKHDRLINELDTQYREKDLKKCIDAIKSLVFKWLTSSRPEEENIQTYMKCFGLEFNSEAGFQLRTEEGYLHHTDSQASLNSSVNSRRDKNKKKEKKDEPKRKELYLGTEALEHSNYNKELTACAHISGIINNQKTFCVIAESQNWVAVKKNMLKLLSCVQDRIQHQLQILLHYTASIQKRLDTKENVKNFFRDVGVFFEPTDVQDEFTIQDDAISADEDEDEDEFLSDTEDNESENKKEEEKKHTSRFGAVVFNGLSEKLLHVYDFSNADMSSFEVGMRYLLSICAHKQYRREGVEMRERKIIHKHTLLRDKDTNECICEICGEAESKHAFNEHRRNDHAFEFAYEEDVSIQYDTCSWVPLKGSDKTVDGFVRGVLNPSTCQALYGKTLSCKDRIIKELSNTYQDHSFPVLQRQKSDEKWYKCFVFEWCLLQEEL